MTNLAIRYLIVYNIKVKYLTNVWMFDTLCNICRDLSLKLTDFSQYFLILCCINLCEMLSDTIRQIYLQNVYKFPKQRQFC
jgi:hypothetical protein